MIRLTLALLAAALCATAAMAQDGALDAKALPPIWTTIKDPAPPPEPRRTGMVESGEAQIHFAEYGKGAPVLLLHDAFGNGDYWSNQIAALSQKHRVVVIDTRGHGRSTGPVAGLSYETMAADAYAVMRKLRLSGVTLVGWGDGGVTALEITRQHPGWVKELVVFAGHYDRAGLRAEPQETGAAALYAAKAKADYQRLSPAPDFDALFAAQKAMWAAEPHYTPEALAAIKRPTVVMIAAHEETVRREHAEEMARLIPEAQIVMIHGVSHFAPWQDPRKFNETLQFLLGN